MVSRLRYNEFGQRIYQRYGNATESDYDYSPRRQWLEHKRTGIASGYDIQELIYSYDSVGNIVGINQTAIDYYGLGGSYNNVYQYDRQNRLIGAQGNSSPDLFYGFSASYSPSGRIGHDSCGANSVNKKLTYGYDSDGLTHQPRVIYDSIAQASYQLYWDANGNLHEVSNCKSGDARFHNWDVKRSSRA